MKKVVQFSLIFASICLFSSPAWGQLTTRDSVRTVQLWGLSPAFYLPVADLADRYEPFAAATVSYQRKNKKNSFYGLDFDAFYGTSVKNTDAIFGGLTDENGNYIGVNGEFAIMNAGLSGAQITANMGRIFKPHYNPNSGWMVLQGFGLQQTKISVRNERGNYPQLAVPMIYGYDRLHRGVASKSSLRYLHLDNDERINFMVGLTVNTAVTRSVRGFNVDTGLEDSALKLDLSVGVNFTWLLPVYAKQESFFLTD